MVICLIFADYQVVLCMQKGLDAERDRDRKRERGRLLVNLHFVFLILSLYANQEGMLPSTNQKEASKRFFFLSSLMRFFVAGQHFCDRTVSSFWFLDKNNNLGDLQKTPNTIMKVGGVSSAGNKHVYGSLPVQALNWMVGN